MFVKLIEIQWAYEILSAAIVWILAGSKKLGLFFHRISVTSLESVVRKGIMHQPVKVCIKHMYIEQMKMSFGVIYETESCLYLSKSCFSKHLTGFQALSPSPTPVSAFITNALSSGFHLASFYLFLSKLVPYKSFIVVSVPWFDRTSGICSRTRMARYGKVRYSYGNTFP